MKEGKKEGRMERKIKKEQVEAKDTKKEKDEHGLETYKI